jgi:hypothetical protein
MRLITVRYFCHFIQSKMNENDHWRQIYLHIEQKITATQIFSSDIETGCRTLVVVLSLSIRKVVSSSPARDGSVKPKTFKLGSDCSFAKSTSFRSENHGSFGYGLKNEGPMSQWVWHFKELSLLKTMGAWHTYM